MYFWHTKHLVRDLKSGVLSSSEKRKYRIAWVVFGVLVLLATKDTRLSDLFGSWIEIIFSISCLVGFSAYCKQLNQNGDGKEFADRLICISWPELVKFAVYCLMIAIILDLFNRVMPWSDWRIVGAVLTWSLFVFFLYRISLQFKWITDSKNES